MQEKDGLILVNKPSGMTSHDVVNVARRAFGIRRIGHAGTLDPMATGLLILGVGKATKKLGDITGSPKTYNAEITLGATSTTDDKEGVIEKSTNVQPTLERIQDVLEKFTGEILQTPPIFSAIKINGQRAYKIARRGETIKMEPRRITIHKIELVSYKYPLLEIKTDVSSGTYIRSLARDIGRELQTGAYLSKLERTSIGKYKLKDAVELEKIQEAILLV
jgi:tRNA pseudouridine55 synthase